MDLIEQLGGYERAKAFLNATSFTIDELIMMQRSGLRTQHVEIALLEYRRQHNIFEVGDSIIVNDEASSGRIYVIEKNHDNEYFKIRSKDGFRYCRMWRIERHATDAEIKAGKRLEVKSEN